VKNEMMALSTYDQRKAARKILLGNAVFSAPGASFNTALTIDFSTGGLSLFLPKAPDMQGNCAVSFDIPFEYSRHRVMISGRVVSCQQQAPQSYRVGVQFLHADPVSIDLIKTAIANSNMNVGVV
jgi:hypothetical protein